MLAIDGDPSVRLVLPHLVTCFWTVELIGRLSGKCPSMPKRELDIKRRTSIDKEWPFWHSGSREVSLAFTFEHLGASHFTPASFLIAFGCLIRLALDGVMNLHDE